MHRSAFITSVRFRALGNAYAAVPGDRSWEETTSNLYRNGGLAITTAHMTAHFAVGESLVGTERAFAVKCNC
jgi:hypothetical protein